MAKNKQEKSGGRLFGLKKWLKFVAVIGIIIGISLLLIWALAYRFDWGKMWLDIVSSNHTSIIPMKR